jgi:YD repeat-containing protein
MMRKIIYLIIAVIINTTLVHCQTITYSYDDNGNRVSRTLVTEQLKSAVINFPVNKADELAPAEDQKEKLIEGETKIRIYPNPTRGIVKVEILNLPEDANSKLMLYNLSGVLLLDENNLNQFSELDISRFKDGIYILRIVINGIITNWKIIKNTN